MREIARSRVEALQDEICAAIEKIDGGAGFREELWTRPGGGGGRTRILAEGKVFEKAGVNTAAVHGPVPTALEGELLGDGPDFYATGVSLVLHPRNPHIPTVHANFRYIERGDASWFGGGADLTPYVLYEEDARLFHGELKAACDDHDPAFYPKFKTWCDRYFRNHHRGEARGVGGIFFDTVRPDEKHDMDSLLAWWKRTGDAFIPAYMPIVERRVEHAYDDALRQWQLQRRGRYVEFNLIHDRGTAFGLKTDGRIESIFMSLPPLVRWDYSVQAEPGSREAKLIDVLVNPREWV
jgi:coproporphyrinogen III oxidase